MEKDKIELKYNKIRKLVQYRDLPKDKVMEIARQKILEEEEKNRYEFIFEGITVANKQEKKLLEGILHRYLDGVHIENNRQLFDLKDLVYNEFKKEVTRTSIENERKKNEFAVPRVQLEILNNLIEQGQRLAERLFGKNLKDDNSKLALLFDKFKLWLKENQGTRSFICAHCSKMLVAKIRMDKYEIGKHPYFKDRLLTNDFLMEKYIEGKPVIIDENFIAKLLQVSPMYADWYLERHFNKNHPLYSKYLTLIESKKSKKVKQP